MPPEPADARAYGTKPCSQRRGGIIAEMFSSDILDTIDAALAKVRLAEKAE